MSYIGNSLPANFQSLPAVQRFNGDGSDTTFTLAAQIANDQSILVSVDGVTQDSNAYSVSGTTLTFTSAPSAGTGNIFVNTISPVGSTITHPASDPLSASTGTFSGALSATTGTFSGKITADAGIDIDNFNIDGTTIALSSGAMTLDAAGDIILDAQGANIFLKDDGTTYGKLDKYGNSFRINNPISDGDVLIQGNDGGSDITALTFDMSEAGYATFNNWLKVNDRVVGNSNLVLNTSDGNEKIHLDASGYIKLETAGSERMRIDSAGQVGIGATNPDALLHLKGGNEVAKIKFEVGTADADKFKIYASTAGRLYVNSYSGNTGVYLTYNGTSWTSNSDETLKDNITSLGTVGDKLKNYRTSYFNWKADTDTPPKRNIGFIAQDWETDFPEVLTKKEGEPMGMQYTETIPILLKYIQELEARITALET